MKLLYKICFLFIFYLLTAQEAMAYLDPGSGSFILQIVIGSFLGGIIFVKTYYRKIKLFIIKLFKNNNKYNEHE